MIKLYDLFLNSSGVSIDSRSIINNTVFFALKGDRFNGNDYAIESVKKGAKIAVVDDEKLKHVDNCFYVNDVYQALIELAIIHRNNLNCSVISITGTNGKTTTKELMACVLSKKFNVAYTQGNLNNQIGLPLTILRTKPDADILILEMGASKKGDIKFLCDIAKPDYGIVTNIGKAHLEGFLNIQNILEEKTKLYDYVKKFGKGLIVNKDDESLLEKAKKNILMTYGNANADVTYDKLENNPFLTFQWQYSGNQYSQSTKLIGSYNIMNALVSICFGLMFKVKPNDIIDAIASYTPNNNRSQLIETINNNRVILDAYNANPSSMLLALDYFSNLKAKQKALLLGSMLELGENSSKEHKNILKRIEISNYNKVFLIGIEFREFEVDYPDFYFFEKIDDLIEFINQNPINDSYVLVKGSRGIAVEKVINHL